MMRTLRACAPCVLLSGPAVLVVACACAGAAARVQAAGDSTVPTAPTAEARADEAGATESGAAESAEAQAGPATIVEEGSCTDDSYCKVIRLQAPAEGRMVTLRAEGATLTFSFGDFLLAARERDEREVVAFLDGRPSGENPVPLAAATQFPAYNRVQFIAAALLEEGKARVRDHVEDRDVESIVWETWDWMGCGGGCRQSGREFRLRIPGDVFFRVTDEYDDSF
jgi:hypothetical protein